jgi:hypothetical protein
LKTGVAAIKPSDCGRAKVGEELFPGVRGSVGDEVVEGVGVKVLQLVLKIGCRAGRREVGVVPDGLGERAIAGGFEGGEFEVSMLDEGLDPKLGEVGGDVRI